MRTAILVSALVIAEQIRVSTNSPYADAPFRAGIFFILLVFLAADLLDWKKKHE